MAAKIMTRAEAGNGVEFYQKTGKMGGKIGGATTKERCGIEFYREIGRKGGLK